MPFSTKQEIKGLLHAVGSVHTSGL